MVMGLLEGLQNREISRLLRLTSNEYLKARLPLEFQVDLTKLQHHGLFVRKAFKHLLSLVLLLVRKHTQAHVTIFYHILTSRCPPTNLMTATEAPGTEVLVGARLTKLLVLLRTHRLHARQARAAVPAIRMTKANGDGPAATALTATYPSPTTSAAWSVATAEMMDATSGHWPKAWMGTQGVKGVMASLPNSHTCFMTGWARKGRC
ncbi:hypothetical protein F4678DRAFT_280719 [Xylaria arbuscula]|nr:hypothetical protein F4678DRAFT_280719 [Xylaria arbuscula]